MILTLIFTLFSALLLAPSSGTGVIFASEGVNPYESIWQAVIQVESSGNPLAVGDKNLKRYSYGIAQIRQSRLDDYYRQTGIRYYETDMFCPVKSKSVFMYYASQIDYRDSERISRLWNGGNKGMQKKSTIPYWKKINKHLNQ